MDFIGGGTDAVLIFGKTWKWIEFCEWHGEEEKSDRRLMELESNFASAAEVDLLQSSLVLLWSLVYAEHEFWSCLKASSFHDVSWESDLSSSSSKSFSTGGFCGLRAIWFWSWWQGHELISSSDLPTYYSSFILLRAGRSYYCIPIFSAVRKT